MSSGKISDYQAKYYAHLLTRKSAANDREKLMGTIMDAQVEPKPHQIEAALFAFRSPFSKGAILADEVGLGKTIEAGIIISQYWSEHKRNLLIIAPANLRQQWAQELLSKFFLKSEILDSAKINKRIEQSKDLIAPGKVTIVSYDFARRYSELLSAIKWDLLVIDEAHRLRNVYKADNVTANIIKKTFKSIPKLLLTATPLQNSLLELYGLVSIIDQNYFGSFEAFKNEYVTSSNSNSKTAAKKIGELRKRLAPVANRSLRNQVQEYINYTNRKSFTQTFQPTAEEIRLYDLVTEYLGRDELFAFTSSQRALTSLLMLKLLGSSSHAIATTLSRLANRVDEEAKEGIKRDARGHKIFDDDIEELIEEDLEDSNTELAKNEGRKLTPQEIKLMQLEAKELRMMADIANSIKKESKGEALLKALDYGFNELPKLKANKKAIIFTESTRTQDYLYELLNNNGYQNKVVKFNGSGGGPEGNEIYLDWLKNNQDSDKISGVKTADRRQAIVDYFKDEAEIMIATEAAGEGINLQFCSMVINYDLPWNPQRVEQRIGRCHRYGQRSDVIVVNFLNEHNKAEQRILELLDEKFKLFNGVFGASDQILGTIESGIDFERKIADIVRTCRTTQQIEDSFDQLQDEMSDKINKKMNDTRKALLDNFDKEVAERLKISRDESGHYISKYEEWLWQLAKHHLAGTAEFDNSNHTFVLNHKVDGAPDGTYFIGNQSIPGHKLRLAHPLSEHIITKAKHTQTPQANISLKYTGNTKALKNYIGDTGIIVVCKYSLSSAAQTEEHIVTVAVTDSGKVIPSDLAPRLLEEDFVKAEKTTELLESSKYTTEAIDNIRKEIKTRDAEYLKEEGAKFDAWAEDMRRAAKLKMTNTDKQIKELKKDIRNINDPMEELSVRRKLRNLERKRDDMELEYRKKLREIDSKTDALLDNIEASLKAIENVEDIFTISWQLQ